MNKLYISPKTGKVEVIDVPEEPERSDDYYSQFHHPDLERNVDKAVYQKVITAAKEAGIEVKDFGKSDYVRLICSKPPLPDTIHDLPEGWRVEIKEELYMDNAFRSKKVAVLLPPVSEKVESQGELWEQVGRNRDFYGHAVWLKRVQELFTITHKS